VSFILDGLLKIKIFTYGKGQKKKAVRRGIMKDKEKE
jgi:hypothetical protein